MNYKINYEKWGVPYIKIGSGYLVSREDAKTCIEKIYSEDFDFFGYDAFTVFPNGRRQPHMPYCAGFSIEKQKTVEQAVDSIKDDPEEITHYEFIFREKPE